MEIQFPSWHMRLMGIDYGVKRIGVALSDESIGFAFAHSVVENNENTLKKIKKICGENEVGKIILGESIDYLGRPNQVMKKIEPFKKLLEKEIGLPIEYQSEVLTTQEARRGPTMGEARPPLSNKRIKSRGRQDKIEKIDASAASLILRSYIERQKWYNSKQCQ